MNRTFLIAFQASLLLSIASFRLIAGEIQTKTFTVECLPVCFVRLDDKSEYEWSSPVFSRSGKRFQNTEEYEAFLMADSLFMRSTGCKLGSRPVANELSPTLFSAPPFRILTSPLAGTFGHSWINNTKIGTNGDWDGKANMELFDLIDLFGVVPDRDCYRFVNQLEIQGALILPFAGIDFERLDNFPKEINSLVVYNSEIGKAFVERIQKNRSVNRLVLWGCYAHDGLDPNVFEPFSSSLRDLSIISCSGSLTQAIISAPWREVEHIALNSEPNVPLHRYVMPKLEKITYYFQPLDNQLDYSGGWHLRTKQSYARMLLNGRDGILEYVVISP